MSQGVVKEIAAIQSHKNQLSSIEAARGIAAVMVVFYHAARHLKADTGYLPWQGVSQFGHSGVDFFFVLSGFIIMFVHRKDLGNPHTLLKYFERRFTRIYPYFWFSLGIGIVLTLLSSKNKTLDLAFILSTATLLPFGGDVGVAWTLQHEILFYLVFAVAIFNWRLGLGLFASWMILVFTIWDAATTPSSFPLIQKLVAPVNLEFFFGLAAAYVVQSRRLNSFKICAWIGAAVFLTIGIAENLGMFDGYAPSSQLAYGSASALIVMGIATAELRGGLRVPKLLTVLGSASYSIYLFHLPCIGVVYKLLAVTDLLKTIPIPMLYAILVATGVFGGVLLSQMVVYPLMNYVRGILSHRPKRHPKA
ncbi:MAG: acyltransferase [Candidatus Saccharibacteria bacterium]|nr:acyltransferase [Moraxellaceae bacterium]